MNVRRRIHPSRSSEGRLALFHWEVQDTGKEREKPPRLDCRPHARRRTDNLQQHNDGLLRANSQHIFGLDVAAKLAHGVERHRRPAG